jgi:hypothetical protein
MVQDLEAPCAPGSIDWSRLYRARAGEVVAHRPYFTGDVFERVEVQNPDGSAKRRSVMIVQHPCAMRTNGVDLVPKLLVAELRNHRALSPEQWTGFIKNMPLPDLIPTVTSGRRSQAAFFDELYLVTPEGLANRIACLSQLGVTSSSSVGSTTTAASSSPPRRITRPRAGCTRRPISSKNCARSVLL